MNSISSTNITFISLGYNCSVKIFLNQTIDQPTNIFDWIGSPMWGINKFIENNYNLFNEDEYKKLQIFSENIDYTHLKCNTKYYFKFLHDLPTDSSINKTYIMHNKNGEIIKINNFTNFKNKYQRRIERFKELLNSNKLIVFIRLEECTKNKIIHDEYRELDLKSELDYIKEFIILIKNKYSTLNFKLIFLSNTNPTELNNNLLILNNTNNDISDTFNNNIELINLLLKS